MNYQRPELLERLAADYVLGVMRLRSRARFESLCARQPAVNAARMRWEDRLLPLALACRPAAPSAAAWNAIEQRIFPGRGARPAREPRRLGWRAAVAAGLVGIALLIGIQTLLLRPDWQPLAQLAQAQAAPLWQVEQTADAAQIHIRTVGVVTLPATQSYELWILPKNGGKPVSLGLLPRSGELARTLTSQQRLQLLAAASLAVSIEPLSGSPTGQPTGPVVVVAPIARAS